MADPTDHLTAVRAALDLAAKATPGPWRYADDDPTHPIMAGRHVEVACGSTPRDLGGDPAIEWNRDADPLAIAAMHNAAPGLRAALDELERLRAERAALLAAAEERDCDMHARIRLGYDATIADAWRAKVAEVEVERDDACAEVERLRGERDKAFDRGRAVGRDDVGKYSYAIGQIEGVLGIAGAQPLAETVKEVRRLRTENDLLHRREPTIDEMNLALVDRDELSPGDPYPPGWPTIRRCLHCRAPVAGGPTACVSCVTRAENHGLSLTNEAMAKYIEDLTEQLEKPEDVRLREVIAAMEGVKEHLPNLPARIDAVLDELDEMIERAGRAERGWDAAIAAANEARR